jgi:hypothetical protein
LAAVAVAVAPAPGTVVVVVVASVASMVATANTPAQTLSLRMFVEEKNFRGKTFFL